MAEKASGRLTARTAKKAAAAIGPSATAITSGPFAYSVAITGDTTRFYQDLDQLAADFPQIMQALGQSSPIPITGDVAPLVANLQQAQQAAQQAGQQAGQSYAQGFQQGSSQSAQQSPLRMANEMLREQQALRAEAVQSGESIQRGLTQQIQEARQQTQSLASDWARVNAAVQQANALPTQMPGGLQGVNQARDIAARLETLTSRAQALSASGTIGPEAEQHLLGAQGFAADFPAGRTGSVFSNAELRQGYEQELEASRQILQTRLSEVEAMQQLAARTELMATLQARAAQGEQVIAQNRAREQEQAAQQLVQEEQFDQRHAQAQAQLAPLEQQRTQLVQQRVAAAEAEAAAEKVARQEAMEAISQQRALVPTGNQQVYSQFPGGVTEAELAQIDRMTASYSRLFQEWNTPGAQAYMAFEQGGEPSSRAAAGNYPAENAPTTPLMEPQSGGALSSRTSLSGPVEIRAFNTETQAMVDNVRRVETSWASFSSAIDRVQSGVEKVTGGIRTATQSALAWGQGQQTVSTAVQGAETQTERQISGIQRFNEQLGYSVGLVARYTLIYGAINAITGAIGQMYEVTQRATNAQFELGRALSASTQPQVAARVEQASNAIAEPAGLGRVTTLESAADLSKLRNEYHLSEQQIVKLTEVTTDLAAVNQRDLITTANAVSLAIRGQSRSLESYGITLSEDAIKKFAGLTEEQRKYYSDLGADEQAQIRFNELIRQAGLYHGAAAEYADKQVSAYQRLGAAMENIAQDVGSGGGALSSFVDKLAVAASSVDKLLQADQILRQHSQDQRDLEEQAGVPAQYRTSTDAGNQTVGIGGGQVRVTTPGENGPGVAPGGYPLGTGGQNDELTARIAALLGLGAPNGSRPPEPTPSPYEGLAGRPPNPTSQGLGNDLLGMIGIHGSGPAPGATDQQQAFDAAINDWVRRRYIEIYQKDVVATQNEYEGGARGEQQDLPDPTRLRKDQEQELERLQRQGLDEQRRNSEDQLRLEKIGYENQGKDAHAHFDELKRGYDADLLESKRVSDAKRDAGLDAVKLQEEASQRARTLIDRDSQDRKQLEDDAITQTHEHQLRALEEQHNAITRTYAAEAENIRRNGAEAERAISERIAGINRVYDTEQRRLADQERSETEHLQGQLDALDKQEQKRADAQQDEQQRQAIADAQQHLADLQSKPQKPSPDTTRTGSNQPPVNFGGLNAHLPTPDAGYKQENYQYGIDQQKEQVVSAQRSLAEAEAQVQETEHQREVRSQREALQQQLATLREHYADQRDTRANAHQQEVADLQAQTEAVRNSTQAQLDSIQAAKDAENDRYSSARDTLTRLFAGEEALVARRRELESRDLQDRRAAEDEFYRERAEAVRQTYDYETRTAQDQHDYEIALAQNVLDNRKAMLAYYVQVVEEANRKLQEEIQRYNESGNIQSTDVGASITAGLAWGVVAVGAQGQLDKNARSLIKNTIGSMNDEAEAHSPSRKTYRLGLDLGSGLVMGMDESAAAVGQSSASLVAAANQSAAQTAGALATQNSAVTNASQVTQNESTSAGDVAVQQNGRVTDALKRVTGVLTGDWKSAWDQAAGSVEVASAAINTSVDQVGAAIDKLHDKSASILSAYTAGKGQVNGASGGSTQAGAQTGPATGIPDRTTGTGTNGGSSVFNAGYDLGQGPVPNDVAQRRRSAERVAEQAAADRARANFAAGRAAPSEASKRAMDGIGGAIDWSGIPMRAATAAMPRPNAGGPSSTVVEGGRSVSVNAPLIGTINVRNDQDKEHIVATIQHVFGVLEGGYADMVAAG